MTCYMHMHISLIHMHAFRKHDAATGGSKPQAAEARFLAKVRSRNRAPWRAGSCSLCQET